MVQSVENCLEETFNVDNTGLYLYDSSEIRLKLLFAKGFNRDEFLDADQTAMERHPGLVFRTGKMIYIPDTLLDNNHLTKSSKHSFDVRSRLYLPVMNGNNIVGAFGIVNSKPNAYDEEDIALLSFICNMAGALYSNLMNQKELKKSEAKHAKMLANISDVIVIIDKDGINTYNSPNILKLFGRKPKEVIGSSVFKNIHPEDHQNLLHIFTLALKEPNNTFVTDFRYRCKEGGYKWVHFTGVNLLHDPDIQGILGNYHDITEMKLAESLLKESEAKFNNIFNSSPALMLLLTVPQRKISAVNDTFLQKTGLSRDEIIGKVITDVDQLNFAYQQPVVARELEKSQRIDGLELVMSTKKGNTLNVVLSRELIESFGKQYFLVLITDITDIKQAEQKLRESEERFDNLAEHGRVITWEVDNKGLYAYISPVCISVLNFYPEEIVGKKHFYDLHPEEGRESFRSAAFDIFSQKEPFRNLLNKAVSKTGRLIWLSTNGIPIIDSNGNLTGYRGIDTDITEQKEAEEDLNKLYRAVNQSPVMTYITDLNGTIEFINPKVEEITGFTREELLGNNPRIFSSDKNPKEMYTLLWQTIISGKEWKGEFINRKKNGELYWVLATISPVMDLGGKITHFIAIEEDITQRKGHYDELQIANLRFRLLISSMQAGVMVEDEQRRVVLVNQHFCDLFSIPAPPEQLIGMDCEVAAHQSKLLFADPDTFIRDIDNTLTIHEVVINHELKMNNGVALERDFVPIEDPDKKNQGILWIYRDITQRKNSERDLLRQSQVLSGTAQAMNHLLTLHDHDLAIQKALEAIGVATGVDRAYLFENIENKTTGESILFQRFEWTAEGVVPQIDNLELQNMPFSEDFPRWFNLLSNGQILSGLVKEFPENERLFLESQDIISLIVVPIFVNDKFWGTVGFDDCKIGIQWTTNELSILQALAGSIGGSISRRIIENELINSRQIAEYATKTKSEFLATMSHEIRTPMNGVIGMTSLLLQTLLTHEQRDYTETIKLSGELLLNLINDILDFSKIESGKMELEEQIFDLRTAVEDVLDLMATSASNKKLGLYFHVDPAIPNKIVGDLTRLRQILVNLVSNAVKFTAEGEVVIRVKQIELQEDNITVEFSVKDTGMGIPDKKIDMLFKPFSQVDASTTRKYGGTGLGLAICSKLVKLMDGNIWVESELNHGSEFHFTIKAKHKIEQQDAPISSPTHQIMNGKKILIADNHITSNEILNSLFKNMGMRTLLAVSTHEVLAHIDNQKDIDVIVIDDDLPGIESKLLAIEIKKRINYASHQLVLITYPIMKENGADNNHFYSLINKPLKHSQLINFVIKLLSNRQNKQMHKYNEPKQIKKLNEQFPLNILVAEDNTINQKLILRLFDMLGYSVYIAANGYEVIETLNRMKIDIVFMDIQMPEMDGFEATKQIIAQWGIQKPMIVAMTANALSSDKDKCLNAGMDDYISKPLTIDQIRKGIEKWALALQTGKM